ncbi:MAG: hypothetical protein MIO92_15305 [Methanosarcinaceae archaeon]|nr:hypothetical protein [Methanosarcinaceae archaeon]
MGSVQQNPELGTGEKFMKAFGKVFITCLLPIVWVIRKIRRPYWDKK